MEDVSKEECLIKSLSLFFSFEDINHVVMWDIKWNSLWICDGDVDMSEIYCTSLLRVKKKHDNEKN